MSEIRPARPKNVGPGARRAAAVLIGLGPEVASGLFREFGENELRRVANGARELRAAPPEEIGEALKEFVQSMERVGGDAVAGDQVLREAASRSLSDDLVRRAFDGVAPPPQPDEVLGPIAEADPEALAMVLSREAPQTIALVLSAIDPERAARTMEFLPEAQRPQILRRMAVVDAVAPEVLREVGMALSAELQAVVAEGMRKVDGKSVALEILRRSSGEQQREAVTQLEQDDPELAQELKSRLFTFEDLKGLHDRDLQTMLREVESTQLTVALKGATDETRDKVLRNMSSRAAQMLADDLAAMGPLKLSAVEAAQAVIVRTAMDLAEQGRITIVRATDKMV